MSNLEWILHQQESQFFERKSCFDRSRGKAKLRPARDVARDVAATLAAIANAGGGTLARGGAGHQGSSGQRNRQAEGASEPPAGRR